MRTLLVACRILTANTITHNTPIKLREYPPPPLSRLPLVWLMIPFHSWMYGL
jgi:hypothetical protein